MSKPLSEDLMEHEPDCSPDVAYSKPVVDTPDSDSIKAWALRRMTQISLTPEQLVTARQQIEQIVKEIAGRKPFDETKRCTCHQASGHSPSCRYHFPKKVVA